MNQHLLRNNNVIMRCESLIVKLLDELKYQQVAEKSSQLLAFSRWLLALGRWLLARVKTVLLFLN